MYKLILDPITKSASVSVVQRTSDSAFIPFDEGNTDYQAYLEWLEQGNEPEPADEAPAVSAEL